MAQDFSRFGGVGIDRAGFDAGLRAHMQSVFNYMAGGLAITGLVAFLIASSPSLSHVIYGTPLRWLAMLAPLGFIMFINVKAASITAASLKRIFWAFCGTMGLSMGVIFLIFTSQSIARAFFITAAMFGAMSLYGYTTKRDLTNFGAFALMGMIGLILASVVNLFLMSSMLNWITSVIGVVIFTGLTAYSVQNIKQSYAENYGAEANEKMAVFGALSLYMNFINAFQYLLSLTGQLRNN